MIFQFTTLVNDDVTDRTSWPHGLYENLSNPFSVFLPGNASWFHVPQWLFDFSQISQESHARIGTTALFGLFFGLAWIIRRKIKKEPILKIAPLSSLNVLFWVSTLSLLFSFGLPMIAGMKWLADCTEPLRQLRILSRFAWPFFYLLNMVVVAALAHRVFYPGAKQIWKVFAGVALVLLFAEGMGNLKNVSVLVKNRIPALEDHENQTVDNQWTHYVKSENYQAIIPLPYFHVGSENIWVEATHGVKEATMIASLKTGIPTTGVDLNRTSISQTFHNYALFTEPLERLEFPDFLPDERPLLLLVLNEYIPNEQELRLIRHSEPITKKPDFMIYELPVTLIRRLNLIYKDEMMAKTQTAGNTEGPGWQLSGNEGFFIYEPFGKTAEKSGFFDAGAFSFQARQWTTVWHDTLKNVPGGTTLLVSFWIKNYRNDGFMRTNIEFCNMNPENHETTFFLYSDFFRYIIAFRGDWVLVEFPVVTKTTNEIAKFSVMNNILPKGEFIIDELMIREEGSDVFWREGRWLWYNNRRVVVR